MTQPEFLRVRILKQLRAAKPCWISRSELGTRLELKQSAICKGLWQQLVLLIEDGFVTRTGPCRSYVFAITPAGLVHLADIESGKIARNGYGVGAQYRSPKVVARQAERARMSEQTRRQAADKTRAFRSWMDEAGDLPELELTDSDLCGPPVDDRRIIRSVAQPGQAPMQPVASVWHLGIHAQQACEGRIGVPNRPKSEFETTAASRPVGTFNGLKAAAR
ncbi:MAG: hypothetical protein KIS62_12380 [Ramlibacter sp.]|nr:hypothetical protein [Ramlibacter sp.]MCW5650535.1 hypothetical protein [Ramlibacter sp.]